MNLRSMFFVLLSIAGRRSETPTANLGLVRESAPPWSIRDRTLLPFLTARRYYELGRLENHYSFLFGDCLKVKTEKKMKPDRKLILFLIAPREFRLVTIRPFFFLYFFSRFPLRVISCQWLLKKVGWRFHRNGWARKALASQSSLVGSSIRTAIKMTNGGELRVWNRLMKSLPRL